MTNPTEPAPETNGPAPGEPGTQDDLSDHAPLDPVQEPGAIPMGPGGDDTSDDPEGDDMPGQRTQ